MIKLEKSPKPEKLTDEFVAEKTEDFKATKNCMEL